MSNVTNGDLKKLIIDLSWPVFLASIFQELYNITNSIIVGNYVSLKALSAISACTWICNIFNYAFYGLGMGTGILIAKYYGANDSDKLKLTMHSSIIFGIVGGLIITIISELAIPSLMSICNISGDLYADAYSYLRIYMLSASVFLTYQMCFYIMRSLGDTKHPLYFLIISCISNIILGVFFVRVLHFDVAGTALATLLSQALIDILSLRLLFNSFDEFRLDIHDIHFSFETIKEICMLGIPAGIQNMLIALSSLMIQSSVNLFSNEIIAGVGVAEKIAAWGQMGSIALSNACMIIVSQNLGAKNYERVQDSIRKIMKYSTIFTAASIVIVFVLARPLVSLFNDSELVREYGTTMIRCMSFSYMFLNISHIYNAACRASGNVKYPMIIAVVSQVLLKFLFVFIGLKIVFSEWVIYFGSAFGYSFAGIFAYLYFRFSKYTKDSKLRA